MKITTQLTRRAVSAVASLTFLANTALAQVTWVVDDTPGPGVHFNTIQAALNVAGPLDLVDVYPGTYAAFMMSSPTRLMGRTGARVIGTGRVQSIGAGEWALVADLQLDVLDLRASAGTIVLDGITCTARRAALVADGCADVRARDFEVAPGYTFPGSLVSISASRIQLDASLINCGGDSGEGTFGATALSATAGAFVHLTECSLKGGDGGDGVTLLFTIPPGDAGPALDLGGGATARIVRSTVRGGVGGFDPDPPFVDGWHGSGLVACGGAHEAWQSTIVAGFDPISTAPVAPDADLQCGATLSTAIDLPSFLVVGTPVAGVAVTLETRAAAGSSVRLIAGRFPVLVPMVGTTIPRLVDTGRIASLGSVPPTGLISVPLGVPSWPRGTMMFLQTSRTGAFGTDFSNAGMLLVR